MVADDNKPTTSSKQETDDLLANILGKSAGVLIWATRNNITLAEAVASHEAIKFVRGVAKSDYYVMYFDLSRISSHPARIEYINSYLQAMRTAVSRMRAAVKRTATHRRLREFGIKLHKIDYVSDCPGLWRIEIDARQRDGRSETLALLDDAVYLALTDETERSLAMPSKFEQHMALRKRGII
jgi:hypothetical protein